MSQETILVTGAAGGVGSTAHTAGMPWTTKDQLAAWVVHLESAPILRSKIIDLESYDAVKDTWK